MWLTDWHFPGSSRGKTFPVNDFNSGYGKRAELPNRAITISIANPQKRKLRGYGEEVAQLDLHLDEHDVEALLTTLLRWRATEHIEERLTGTHSMIEESTFTQAMDRAKRAVQAALAITDE